MNVSNKKMSAGFSFLLFALMTAFVFPARGQTALDGFRVDVNDTVSVIRTDGISTYVAGATFTTVNGTARRQLARINPDGSLDASYNPNPQNASVQAIEMSSGGKLVVVGGFTAIGGGASGGIARLNFDGTNDGTFTAAVSGAGSIAVQPDGKVIIGGSFTTVGSQTRNRLARFNIDGTLDGSFTPDINNSVFGITVQPDGKILINGQFTSVNGQNRWNFARLNPDGSLDPSFFVNTAYPGAGGTTYTSAVQADGKIIVGGTFAHFGDSVTTRNNIARLNPNGSIDATFNLDLNGRVNKIIVQSDDKILLSGAFTTINGAARNFIARLNRNGSVDTSFVASAGAQVNDMATLQDRRIIIGGAFTSVNGFTSINRVARLYPDGRLDGDTNPSVLGGAVFDILSLPNGQTLIAGGFSSVGGATRQGMARLGWTGANDSAFANPQLTGGSANALAVQSNGQYLVGGDFSSAGGTNQARLARFNTNGTLDGTFAPTVTGSASPFVSSIAVQADGKILIGGQFTNINGTTRNGIARLNSLGQTDGTFSASVDNYVDVIAVQADGKILIGGAFENVNGQARAALARLNADGSTDTGFNPVLNGIVREVNDIKIDRSGKILVGGSFPGVNGNNRANLVRLNADGSTDATFAADAIDGTVLSIQLSSEGSYIFIAGRFQNVGTLARPYVAMLNPSGSVNSLFQNTSPNDNIQSMTIREDGRILIGGNFTSVSGQTRNRFAALSRNAPPPLYLMFVSGNQIQWYRSGSGPELGRVVFEHSTDGVNYSFLASGNRPLSNLWSAVIPPGTPSGYIRARGFYDLTDRRSFYEREIYYYVPQNRRSPFDFDNDGKTDIGIFRPSDGSWWYTRSSDNQVRVFSFGLGTDIITPGDFTGDGRADICIFRPSEGKWYVQRSEDNTFFSFPFGTGGDIPAPADYDGDGKTDAAVFRPSTGVWYVLNSGGSGTAIVPFGADGDKPVAADYDGDGRADIAIFRPSDGSWWYLRSSDLQPRVYRFGVGTDKPVPGDFTGDGKADLAVWRPGTGEWYFQRSEDNTYYLLPFGSNGDIPAPGDYDGDGRFDMAVFRPATGNWFIQASTAGTQITAFGANGDRPVPNAFVP